MPTLTATTILTVFQKIYLVASMDHQTADFVGNIKALIAVSLALKISAITERYFGSTMDLSRENLAVLRLCIRIFLFQLIYVSLVFNKIL